MIAVAAYPAGGTPINCYAPPNLKGRAMRFLAGSDLHEAVGNAIAGSGVRCAVAFWGAGAEDLIKDPKTARIVCNLALGGTNPSAIRKLMDRGAEVQQLGSLHAKVYLGAGTAVVTSANASANGLALEGPEQAHWSEAGVELAGAEAAATSDWFEGIWGQAREIRPQDLKRAEELWKARRRQRPEVSFADYDVDAAIRERTLPVTCWWVWGQEWKIDEAAVERAGIGFTAEMLAVEIEDEADRAILPPGTWLLWWRRGRAGAPLSDKLKLSQVGRYEPGVMRHTDGDRPNVGALLKAETPDPQPFDPSGPRFGQAFREVVVRPQFDALRSDAGAPWFTILEPHLPDFWRQVKQRYLELAPA